MGVVRDMDMGMAGVVADVEHLAKSYVIIGFPEGTKTTEESKAIGGHLHKKKGGLNMAQIAAENEFGTRKTPARSFMRTAFDENITSLSTILQKEYARIIDGKSTVKYSLNLIGNIMRDLIKKKIREITLPPNAPLTIALKGSSKPLIDFGQMINAVQHKVVLK